MKRWAIGTKVVPIRKTRGTCTLKVIKDIMQSQGVEFLYVIPNMLIQIENNEEIYHCHWKKDYWTNEVLLFNHSDLVPYEPNSNRSAIYLLNKKSIHRLEG